eukprot:TRINITY_DN60264_c0_g1_i1.p1 TRINITY_DN60264_c0_g1~~TRINITY_DN60264_c0_g1_i1.p1  ORF type:complete len:567 (-),score=24.17 TRINITY_DN60264_c0_g1_i1:994-2463(-)
MPASPVQPLHSHQPAEASPLPQPPKSNKRKRERIPPLSNTWEWIRKTLGPVRNANQNNNKPNPIVIDPPSSLEPTLPPEPPSPPMKRHKPNSAALTADGDPDFANLTPVRVSTADHHTSSPQLNLDNQVHTPPAQRASMMPPTLRRTTPVPSPPLSVPTTNFDRSNSHSGVGLQNPLGRNNCFLNVVLQSLWHIKPFRQRFLQNTKTSQGCRCNRCLLCRTQSLFLAYSRVAGTHCRSLNPDIVRKAVADHYADSDRFQMGAFDDAAELLEEILQYFATATNGKMEASDVFSVFGSVMSTDWECKDCGWHSESDVFPTFLHLFPAARVIQAAPQGVGTSTAEAFENVLAAYFREEWKTCARCAKCLPSKVSMLRCPTVLSLRVAWPSDSMTRSEMETFITHVPLRLDLSKIFHCGMAEDAEQLHYALVGLVLFYGHHYIAFFTKPLLEDWVSFDDTTVSQKGTWANVMDAVVGGRQQPVLLFYQKLGAG